MDRHIMSLARMSSLQPSCEQQAVAATSRCDLLEDGRLVGFIFDPKSPERRFTVDILLDGLVVATTYADKFVSKLFEQGIGDGSYGFVVDLAPDLLATSRTLHARLANLGTPIGKPLDLAEINRNMVSTPVAAELRWLGGLRFLGW